MSQKKRNDEEYISVKKAKQELGDQAYFAFHRWLVDKGYRNLDDVYVTKRQLEEFVAETAKGLRGLSDTGALWGQTREVWREYKGVKKKK